MEFMLAMWANGQGFVQFLAVMALVFVVLAHLYAAIVLGCCPDKDETARAGLARRYANRTLPAFVALGLISCVPTIDDLWKARIAIVKYQLAAPENVRAATETIERIGKKLECKYLGGNGCEAKP